MISIGPEEGRLACEWHGIMDYPAAERLQCLYEGERARGQRTDTLIMLEHPHVITLGRSATADDILVSEADLAAHHVGTQRCDRGGKVTYHGPGQLVGYLIVDLRALKLTVPRFVFLVEEGLRQWFEQMGLVVERRCKRPGLWYGDEKIASLGFHISRGISRHGFAMNLDPELKYFEWIVPCGARIKTTSVARVLSKKLSAAAAAPSVARNLNQIFASLSSSSSRTSSGVSSELAATELRVGDSFSSS